MARSVRPEAITVVTGRPRPAALDGRSSLSHLDTRWGSVEMISSSKPWMLTASWIAASGSGTPIMPSPGPPTAGPRPGRGGPGAPGPAARGLEQGRGELERLLGLRPRLILGVDELVQAVRRVGHKEREGRRSA